MENCASRLFVGRISVDRLESQWHYLGMISGIQMGRILAGTVRCSGIPVEKQIVVAGCKTIRIWCAMVVWYW
jgi:hypothetical protein